MSDDTTLPVRSDRRALTADLDARRRDLKAATRDLRIAATQWVDPREYVRASPVPWVVGAGLVGFWLGARRRVR